MGKEPKLVCEGKTFRIDLIGLTWMFGRGSGTSLLERGWTLFRSGVAESERKRAVVQILLLPNPESVHWSSPQ